MGRCTAFAVLLAFVCGASTAESQTVLTVDRVLDLVEQQNPQVLLARAQVLEAQGVLTAARARLATNPGVDAFLGSRPTGTGRSAEIELSVLQRFEIAGQRGHRIDAASAGVSQQEFEVAAATLEAQTAALAALYRAAHAEDIHRVAQEALSLAEEAVRAAQARYEAGETAILDVNVARVEQARARREQLATAARREGALGLLRDVLALPAEEPLRIEVPLRTPEVPALDALLPRVAERADLRALAANVTQSEARLRLAAAGRIPDVFGGVGFRREDGQPIAGARLGVTLPIFQRQRGAIRAASARLSESRTALDARRRALDARLRAAYAQYTIAVQAAEAIAATAVPLLEENEALARDSYQAGKIGLLELLVIRREGFAARREALEAQLEATMAAIEVRAMAGLVR